MESEFKFGTSGSDSMLNYNLSQKLKLLGMGKFNHLIHILTFPLTMWAQTLL